MRALITLLYSHGCLERFRVVSSATYRGAHAIIVVFDVTNRESFNNVKHWLQDIDRYACDNVNKLLVGNGCDKLSTRTVDKQTVEEFADSLGITYVETSAKNGTGVEDAFMTVTRAVKSRIEATSEVKPPIPVRTSLADRLFSKEVRNLASHYSSLAAA